MATLGCRADALRPLAAEALVEFPAATAQERRIYHVVSSGTQIGDFLQISDG